MELKVENISKSYGKLKALTSVELVINNGIFGLLGPNGAGKTSLMRVIAGLLPQTEGSIWLDGMKMDQHDVIRDRISYLPQEFGFYPGLSVFDNLDYLASLSGVTKRNERKEIVEALLLKVNLQMHKRKKARELSGGMKRRLGVAASLLKNPRVLIVDEPTAGLDPEERLRLRNLLLEFSKERIVILSTHIVEDVMSTCQQIAVINDGEIIFNESIGQAIEDVKGFVWEAVIKKNQLNEVQSEYQVLQITPQEHKVKIRLLADESILKRLPTVHQIQPTLEDAYMYMLSSMYGKAYHMAV